MADPLDVIVQRMIDAGEPEHNIAAVIKEYRPFNPPMSHTPAAMLGAPSAPYPEGVNPAETTNNRIASALEPLAHPQSLADIGRLVLAPTDITRGAMSLTPMIGRGATATGLALERAGQSGAAQTAGGAGTIGLLAHGNWKSALASAIAPPTMSGIGKGLQVAGRMLSGQPDPAGMASGVMNAVTTPGGPVLNNWESQFLGSVDEQLQAGRALTAAQKIALSRIYGRIIPGVPQAINPLSDFKPSDVNIQLNDASKMSPESLGTLNRFMETPTTEAVPDLAGLRRDAIYGRLIR